MQQEVKDDKHSCRYCDTPIIFSSRWVTKRGKRIPMDIEGGIHHCKLATEEFEERLVLETIQYVVAVNRRLTTCKLSIVREDFSA